MVKNKILPILLISLIFGLAGGVLGEMLTRAYLIENELNVPFFGKLDFRTSDINSPNIIIQSPRNVVVEQNTKVLETANSLKSTILGIFKKLPETEQAKIPTNEHKISAYYQNSQELSQGFVITSDGWIISSYIPPELSALKGSASSTIRKKINTLVEKYVLISSEKKIFKVKNIIIDNILNISYWQIDAKDLPVKQFADINSLNNGELIIFVNWDNWVWLTTIAQYRQNDSLYRFSDRIEKQFIFSQNPRDDFGSGFAFNLNGDFLGIYANKKVISIDNLRTCINCLLRQEDLARPSLGLYYINRSELISAKQNNGELKGALIAAPGNGKAFTAESPAKKAGLKEGDIIISVNNMEITKNNDLNDIISGLSAGELVNITFLRSGKKDNIEFKLGKME